MQRYVAPSLLSADFANLQKEIEMINSCDAADFIHLDVMDGIFVPNLTIGFPVIRRIHEIAQKPLDVHAMMIDPNKFISLFKEVGTHTLMIHYEVCYHLHRTIERIKNNGMNAGVTLNPHTPVHLLEEVIADLDQVLIMSVNPGYGGQTFISNSPDKVKRLRELIERKQSHALIEIDGGINEYNAAEMYEAGVNILVSGNTIFTAQNPHEMIRKMKYPEQYS